MQLNNKQKQFTKFSEERLEQYRKSGYKVVGRHKHTGIELCRWTKSVLRGKRNCYKSFYGVSSHRCIQMTPTLDFCNFSCKFCWRTFGKYRFKSGDKWDRPNRILDEIIIAQRKLVSGFGGNKNTKRAILDEANKPNHITLSLDGEPMLYPYLAELIKEIKNRGMSVFLVTNGTMPHKLKELLKKNAEPTNLTISVYATNKKDYKEITNPIVKDSFERILESLKLMKKFKKARTIFKITLVKGLNMKDLEGYATLINKAKPKFIHLKGYTWVGESRKRLKINNMPYTKEIEDFAEEIAKLTGYKIKLKDNISRIVILGKN
ncbi:MAG: 4-demethylwyosine synthase TYW1 [Nanoarchaeota archaeon]